MWSRSYERNNRSHTLGGIKTHFIFQVLIFVKQIYAMLRMLWKRLGPLTPKLPEAKQQHQNARNVILIRSHSCRTSQGYDYEPPAASTTCIIINIRPKHKSKYVHFCEKHDFHSENLAFHKNGHTSFCHCRADLSV